MLSHIITEPADEPVSLDEAKKQLVLETDEDDDQVSMLVGAARKYVEKYLNRVLIQQTWEIVLPGFPRHYYGDPGNTHGLGPILGNSQWGYGYFGPENAGYDLRIELTRGQLAEIDTPVLSVKYIDTNGVQQTLNPSQYSVDNVSVPGCVHRAFNVTWPDTRPQWDAVRVQFVVGWTIDTIPEPIKQAVVLLVSQMYEHRTPEVDSRALTPVLFSFQALLDVYKVHTLGR